MLKSLTNIFRADELVGFKDSVEDYKPYKLQPTAKELPNFFCINPIKSYSDLKYENISEFRNFLVEFDSARLSTQERWVAESGMPYSLKTFSGNKSYHYIIALDSSIELQEYRQLAAIILEFIFRGKADESCKNPNRLSRTPGAIRGGKEQKLIEQSPAISPDALREWVYEINKNAWFSYKVAEQAEGERRAKANEYVRANGVDAADSNKLLQIFFPEWEQVLANDKVATGRRHSVAVSAAIKMYQCGLDPDKIADKITSFLQSNGKGASAWQEASGVVSWVTKRIAPFNFDQNVD